MSHELDREINLDGTLDANTQVRWAEWDLNNSFQEEHREQLVNLINEHQTNIKIFPNKGEGMREAADVKSRKALRIIGEDMYHGLVDLDGAHWFDDFYRGPLLKLTQDNLGNDKIKPAEDPNDAYVINGLVHPDDQFIFHVDTKKTASAVIFLTTIPEEQGGEFFIAFTPNVRSFEEVLASSANIVKHPHAFDAMFFYGGGATHGSLPIAPGAPPRLTIACTYLLPGYNKNLRPEGFNDNRRKNKLR